MVAEFLLSLLLVVLGVSAYPQQCLAPGGLSGTCVALNNCRHYNDVVLKTSFSSSLDMREYLLSWKCSNERRNAVCCPIDTVYTEPPPSVERHPNLHLLPDPQDCGEKSPDRLNGGNQTKPMDYPWMALISTETDGELEFTCAGTIINDRYILTAAHCVTQLGRAKLAGVRLGEHDILTDDDCVSEGFCADPVQDIGIKEFITHPGYIGKRSSKFHDLTNDIALIRLDERINLAQNNVYPVCLPIEKKMQNLDLKKADLIITGWGRTNIARDGELVPNLNDLSTRLLVAKLPFVTNKMCAGKFNSSGTGGIGFRQLCAGGERGISSCRGDSGGPLTAQVASGPRSNMLKVVQYGIVSGGVKCGDEGLPSIFTSVAHYMDWILDQLKP